MAFEIYKECFQIGELIGKHLTGALRIQDYRIKFNVSPTQNRRIMEILGVHSNKAKKEFREYIIHVNGYSKTTIKPLRENESTIQENDDVVTLPPIP